MAELLTIQDSIDGRLDTQTLKEAVNEDKWVTARLGKEFASVPMASRLLVENGLLGARPFSTYAKMSAPDVDPPLVDGDYAVVTNELDINKNGVYEKVDGSWIYSKYNLATSLKKISNQIFILAHYELYDSFDDGLETEYIYMLYESFNDGVSGDEAKILGALDGKNIYIDYDYDAKRLTTIWQHTPTMMFKSIWQPNGHNSLFNFKSISQSAGTDPLNASWSVIQEVTTDYIPPVSFLATTGAISESGTNTTGGNHGTSGGSGAITAYMTQCDFYINGSKLTDNYSGFVESIQCRWTNKLYAGNTVNEQRYCLQQDVSADFSHGHVGVILKTIALEPINVIYEGGTQLVGDGWNEAASFYGGETKGFYKQSTMVAGTKTTAPSAWATVLKSPIYGYMAAYIDRNFGVKLTKIGNNDVVANKHATNWKFYNFTMNGLRTSQSMSANESHTWRGGYAYAPLSITDLESAFITKIGTRTAIGYEALAGQKGDINLPSYLVGNDYQGLDTSPDGVYVNASVYQTSLAKEV